MNIILRISLIFFILLLRQTWTFSQYQDTSGVNRDSTHLDSILELPLEILSLNPNTLYTKALDTLQYLIKPKSFFGLSTLNNYGSPVNYLREKRMNTLGFDNGYHLFDFMNLELEHIPFYLANKTYAELTVSEAIFFLNSRAGLIDNLNAGAFLTKNFANHIYFNLKYDRINQKGIYNNSRNLLARLNTQLMYWNDSSRWSYELAYANQFDKIEHSLGVTVDSILSNTSFQVRESVPVVNNSANSVIAGDQFSFKLRYKFLNRTKQTSWLELGVGYKTYTNEFFDDTQPDSINTFYGSTLRLFTDSIISTYQQKSIPVHFNINLLHDSTWSVSINNYFQQVFLMPNSFQEFRRWSLANQLLLDYKGLSHQNIQAKVLRKHQSSQNGHDISIEYINRMNSKFDIASGIEYNSIIPGQLSNRLYINDVTILNHKLKNLNQIEFILGVWSKFKFIPTMSARIGSVTNIFYLDSQQSIKQESKSSQFIDVNIIEDLQFKRVGLLNHFRYLSYNPDPAGWNAWNSRHTFYYNYRLFGSNVVSKFSAFTDFASPSIINGFNPIYSMFYPIKSNNKIIGPFVGVELNAQVSDLNVSLEFSNIDSFWNKKRPYLLAIYPRYDFNMRIQLLWRFKN